MYRFISNIEYIQEFLGARPDLEEYEEYLNDQMRAFDEREQKVFNSPLKYEFADNFIF